jgi:hypothetical protein
MVFFPEVRLRGYGIAKKTGLVRNSGLKEQIHPDTIWRKMTLKQRRLNL